MIIGNDDPRGRAYGTCEALAVHRPAPDKLRGVSRLCLGCYEIDGAFAWYPCPPVRHTQQVLTADSRSEAVKAARPVLAAASKSRERIYAALLGNPERAWTVSQLTDQLPKVSVEVIRATVYHLLNHGLMETMPRSRALKVPLTDSGRAKVAQIRSRSASQVPSNGGA